MADPAAGQLSDPDRYWAALRRLADGETFGVFDEGAQGLAGVMTTFLARKELFDLVGLFDTDLRIAADVDLMARIKDRGIALATFPELVLRKRVHDAGFFVEVDSGADTLNKKIRNGQLAQYNFILGECFSSLAALVAF